ncbi:MAG: methyltransferase domain-containing protein [Reyranellaceae bacterium]
MQLWPDEAVNRFRSHYDEAAAYWAKWADQFAEQQDKVNQALLAAAGVRPGATLLDLASGAGEPAVTAARVVGTEGRVTATDVSVPMVAALTARVARLGLANVRCEQADMEALPFADASFDAVTCRYGLMYARHAARVVAEAARVVRPGGGIAFMVWGPEADNTLLYRGMRAANDFLGRPIADADFAAPSRFAAPGVVAALMSAAGIVGAREQELRFEPRIKVGVPFWAPLLEMNAAHVWRSLTPEQQKNTHQAVAAAYEACRDGDHYVLESHMRIISGRRPDVAA